MCLRSRSRSSGASFDLSRPARALGARGVSAGARTELEDRAIPIAHTQFDEGRAKSNVIPTALRLLAAHGLGDNPADSTNVFPAKLPPSCPYLRYHLWLSVSTHWDRTIASSQIHRQA